MGCQIIKNNKGEISYVLDRNGKESVLFNELAYLPHINSKEEALEIYKQSYKDEIDETQGLSFQTETGLFSNLQEALQLNEEVNVGYFNSEDGFQTLYKIPSQYNKNTKEGFISSFIRDGILSDKKVQYKGQTFFIASGTNYAEQKINQDFLHSEAKKYLGLGSFKVDQGHITINDVQPINKEQFFDKNEIEISNRLVKELTSNKTFPKKQFTPNSISEQSLKLKLLNILDTLGVNTISISEYIEKYEAKNGIEPSAVGLADIANRIVALKDGQATLEDFTEETFHFIVEALPQEQVEGLIESIENSQEYLQYADEYREIYSEKYPENQVEDLVKKEILAKIMKNSLLNRDSNIFQRVLKAITDFINSLFTNNVYSQLNNVNQLVDELFIQDNLNSLNPNQLEGSQITLFSITSVPSGNNALDKLRAINKSILAKLQTGINFMRGTKSNLASENTKLRNLESVINSVSNAGTVLDFLGLIQRKIDVLKSALIRIDNEGGDLTLAEKNLVANIKSGLRDLLSAQKEEIRKLDPSMLGLENTKDKNELINEIEQIDTELGTIIGRTDNISLNNLEEIVDRIADQQELTEQEKERYKERALETGKQAIKDVGFFMSTFGQLIHASDPLLNMTAHVISEMRYKETVETQKAFRPIANRLEDLGITPEQLAKDLTDNGYLLSEIDWNAFNQKLNEVEAQAFSKASAKKYTTDSYLAAKKENTLPNLTPDQYSVYTSTKGELLEPYLEKPMDSTYYEAQRKKYKDLGISNTTIDFLKTLSASRAEVQNEARQEDGTIIYTEDQKHILTSITRKRKAEKSFYNSLGNLKEGINQELSTPSLKQQLENQGTKFIEKGGLIYTLDSNPSQEATRAFDISLIDQQFLEDLSERETNTKKFGKTFFQIVRKQGLSKGIDFVRNNLGVSLSSSFWEKVTREPIIDNEYINSIEDNRPIITQIKELSNRRNEIKKLFQDSSNPSEIEGDEMMNTTKKQIKELTDKIEALKQDLQGIKDVEVSESEIDIQRQANRAYFRALKKKGFQELSKDEEYYLFENMSDRSSSQFRSLLSVAERLDNNLDVSDRQKERLDIFKEGNETYYQAALKYGRTRLLPYYQRFTPEGYETLDDVIDSNKTDLENAKDIVDFIDRKNKDSNYEINIHYTFQPDQDNGFVNPKFDNNFEGGFLQPKKDLFRNEKYFSTFKPNSKGQATDNKNLFEARELFLQLQRDSLKKMGEYKKHNIFLLPQISRTSLNKTVDFIKSKNKGETIKSTLKDTFNYRIDDKAYGEEENGIVLSQATEARTIPKFYLRPLEEKTDVSDDIFWSYLMFTKHANLYKARLEGINDILAIKDKMLSRNYAEGKAPQATSNYKMFEAAINNNFYNIRETRQYKVNLPLFGEVDFTKTLRVLADYIRMRNLGGLNLIVPFTSLLTAEVQIQIERTLGEYLPSDSLRLASREFRKNLIGDASKQSLEYNDNSKLNVLGEFLGVYQNEEKAANARYGVLARTLPKLGFAMHSVGNFPIIPRVFLTELFDNRVVNGRIMNREQFYRNKKATGANKSEYEAEWKQLEEKNLYNYLNITKETVEYKPELIEELNGDLDYLDNKINGIRKRINQNSQFIDGQISEKDRTAAQLNSLWSFVTLHRSFLTIGATRRFKQLQYNLESGRYEEGTYTTLKNTIIDAFGNVGRGENKTLNFLKAFKDAYENPNKQGDLTTQEAIDLRKRNLKRIGIEFGFMGSIILIASILKAASEDEDNQDLYGLQLTNYLFLRLANETSSSQFAIGNELASVIKSPTVGYQNMVDTLSIANAFDNTEIKQGTYRGLTKSEKYWIKALPGMQSYYDLYSPKKKANTYEFYNKSNLDWGSLGLFSILNKE